MFGALDWSPVWNFLFPPFCVSCQRNGSWWCERCQEELGKPENWPCLICNQVESPSAICESCRQFSTLDGVLIASTFTPTLRKVVHHFKYKYASVLAPILGGLLVSELESQELVELGSRVQIMPIPLHPKRESRRGFNQSKLLAEEIIKLKPECRIVTSLTRQQHTTSQMTLDRLSRLYNLEGAFLYDGPNLSGQTILLVDDVCTTGSTLLAAAGAIRPAQPEAIWGLALGHGK